MWRAGAVMLCALLSPAVFVTAQTTPVAPTTPGATPMVDSYEALRKDKDVQWAMPTQVKEPPPTPPEKTNGWVDAVVRFLAEYYYLILTPLVLGLLFFIAYRWYEPFREWFDARFRRMHAAVDDSDDVDHRAAAQAAIGHLAQADALAVQGDYAGAVHHLLWRAIEDIGRRQPDAVQPYLTSRMIAEHPRLAPLVRRAFRDLTLVVEASHFGGRPVTQTIWQGARDSYAALAEPKAWRMT